MSSLPWFQKTQKPTTPQELVKVSSQPKLSLLSAGNYPARTNKLTVFPSDFKPSEIQSILSSWNLSTCGPVAVDLETRGVDPTDPSSCIVGIGISDARGSWYCPGDGRGVVNALQQLNIPCIAHNLFFDGAFILAKYNIWLNWERCTYALYKLLATEGWPGQTWGLKDAQRELLGWKTTNEVKLNNWLVENGYKNQQGTPLKEELWRAPPDIIGQYCALDADSTWLLYTRVLKPALGRFPELDEYSGAQYINYIRLLCEQKITGIAVDKQQMEKYNEQIQTEIEEAEKKFFEHPEVRTAVAFYNQREVAEFAAKEPPRYKKATRKSGKGGKRKNKNTGTDVPLVERKDWQKHQDKLAQMRQTNHFNLNSGPQRAWLFYDALGYPVQLHTDKGNPAVDERALKGFSEPGRLLIDYNERVKEQQYVQAGISHVREGCIHPSFRVPGTLTGRLAGSGGLNIQQVPKSKGYLSCWKARPGTVWVDFDFVSLEQVVLAELSKDYSLWKLYGPTAKPNDVYLFTGAHLPGIGPKIREAGYDPENPTAQGILEAKKKCKRERQVAKIITLGSSYGMGPKKLRRTLYLEGVNISEQDAFEIYKGYWNLYYGIKDYEQELLRQYENNNGWVLNGIGRPLGIAPDYIKDIVNRVVQSTGHDLLIMYINLVDSMLKEEGIDYNPIMIDFHDASTIEVREEDAERVQYIMEKLAIDALNQKVQGDISLKVSGGIVRNLAESKCE